MSTHDHVAGSTTIFGTGAVRSAEANHLDFTSLPLIGLIGVARTAGEGATKYGRLNYMLGMPPHDQINHAFRHLVLFILGDRTEPHLEHAAWNIMAAIQGMALNPELAEPHLLGPGATVTEANRAELKKGEADRQAKRDSGEFNDLGNWKLSDLKEIKTLLGQRRTAKTYRRNLAEAAVRNKRRELFRGAGYAKKFAAAIDRDYEQEEQDRIPLDQSSEFYAARQDRERKEIERERLLLVADLAGITRGWRQFDRTLYLRTGEVPSHEKWMWDDFFSRLAVHQETLDAEKQHNSKSS